MKLNLSVKMAPPTLARDSMFERLSTTLVLLLLLASAASAQTDPPTEPELSADQPISVDFETQELVAVGNARFQHEEIVVEAEEIRFDQNARTITATENVRVTRRGLRVVTESLSYNIDTRAFTSGRFRAGTPPIFVSGESFEGTIDEFEVFGGRFFYREPDNAAPAVYLEHATIVPGERVVGEGASLDLPWFFGIPLPSFNRELGSPAIRADGNVGYRGRLGAYLRTELLAPVSEELNIGGNLDLYSRRGLLIGPALRFRRELDSGSSNVYFSAGWISDQDDPGEDVLGRTISRDRHFAAVSAHHRQHGFEAVLQSTYLSDSEFERDFRPERFNTRPHPQSFLELNQVLAGDWFLSLFIERMPNDFHRTVESGPEIALEMPLRPLGDSGFVHGARLRYQRLRLFGDYNAAVFDRYDGQVPWLEVWPESQLETDEMDDAWYGFAEAVYSLRYPLALNRWLDFTPVLEARYEHWDGDAIAGYDDSAFHGAVGFDMEGMLHGQWNLQNETWGIFGLRHVLRPVVQYRYLLSDHATPGERYFPQFRSTRPEIDFLSRRDRMETSADDHFLRVGVRNSWQTRAPDGSARELLGLNLFYDYRSDAAEERAMPSAYVELSTQPARWLELGFEQRIQTDVGDVEEFRIRSTFRSAETWEISLSADFFDEIYHQYRAAGSYRLSPDTVLVASWRYDARLETLTRQFYALRYQLARSWEVEAGVVFREGAQREDDFSFHLGLRLIEY